MYYGIKIEENRKKCLIFGEIKFFLFLLQI